MSYTFLKNKNLYIFIFIGILLVGYFVQVPYVLSSVPNPKSSIVVSRNAMVLNEFYIKSGLDGNNTYPIHPSKHYFFVDQGNDNHALLPVYRAIKTGVHLTNLGYNEGIWDTYSVDPLQNNKFLNKEDAFVPENRVIANEFYRKSRNKIQTLDLNYKSVYTTLYNNIGMVVYKYISKKTPIISSDEDEIQASKSLTQIRYLFALFHMVTIIGLCIVIYKKFGILVALIVCTFSLIAPIFLYVTLTLSGFLYMFLPFIIYILVFSDLCKYENSLLNKIIFAIGMIFLTVIHQYYSGLASIFTTYGFAMAFLFYILFINSIKEINKMSVYKILYAIFYLSILSFVVGICIFILRAIEMQEAQTLWGASVQEVSSFKKSISTKHLGTGNTYITKIIYLFLKINKNILLSDMNTLFLYIGTYIPIFKFLSLKIVYIVSCFSLYFCFICYKTKLRIVKDNQQLILNIIIAGFVFELYILLACILSPWYMNHMFLVIPTLSFYILLILGFVFGIIHTKFIEYEKSHK